MNATRRKKPRQSRSHASFNAILEATVRILEEDGWEAATTTRIAELAGVSVGTLYQYFSHRDAILESLQEREFERALALMEAALSPNNLTRSPSDTVRDVVRGLAALYTASPALHRAFTVVGLNAANPERVHAFDLRIVGIIRHFLAATSAPVRRANVDAAAFVAYQSVRATMLASLLEHPPGLDHETLVEEVADLILRYLVSGPREARPRSRRRATQ